MILVTGGTGLVGAHLLHHLLEKQETVRALYRRSSDLEGVKRVFGYYGDGAGEKFERIQWVESDILDLVSLRDAFNDISHVYHCAALISFDPSDYQRMRRVNIEGTTNVVNCCIDQKVEKLCYVSSVAAIENKPEGVVMDESDNWNSNADKSGYAITKYGAEMEVWRASQEGVPVVIVNPGVILGSGFWHKGSGVMFKRVDKGMPFYTRGITGFVDVEDVVMIMVRLMESEIENERFVLVGENMMYKDVLDRIAQRMDRKKPGIHLNGLSLQVMWRLEYLRSKLFFSTPLLTKHTARSSISDHPYSSKKVEVELNFEFNPIDTCLDRVVKRYRQG